MNSEHPVIEDELLASLPPPWPHDPLPDVRKALSHSLARKLIVLDDDPTGTQTVRGVPVFADWSVDAMASALMAPEPCAYVLTNSRSLERGEAVALAREIGRNLKRASAATSRPFVVASRGDSTLRGHYPAETDALVEAMESRCDACLLVPFFEAGGRLTINDVHYLREGRQLIPVAQSPFAKDPVFGYRHSDLRLWVEEKTAGRIASRQVCSVGLEVIRREGPEGVARCLSGLAGGCVCIVNAACQRDVEVVAAALVPS